MSHIVPRIYSWILLLLCFPGLASAAEINGHVVDASRQGQVVVSVTGDLLPLPGDRAEIYVEIAGIGRASVAEGIVAISDENSVTVRISQATGQVKTGHKVRVQSARPLQMAGHTVPVLIGRTVADAKQTILAAGFKAVIQIGIAAPTGVKHHTVYDQDPRVGSKLGAGQKITITIYAGTVPSPGNPAGTSEMRQSDARQKVDEEQLIVDRWICTHSYLLGEMTPGNSGRQLVITDGKLFFAGTETGAVSYNLNCDLRPGHLDYEIEPADLLNAKRVEPTGSVTGAHRTLYQLEGDVLTLAENSDAAQRPASITTADIRHVYRRMQRRDGWNALENLSPNVTPSIGAKIARVDSAYGRRAGISRTEGVFIVGVFPDSAAADAGFEPHDVIVEINGQAVRSPHEFAARIKCFSVDEIVLFTVDRKGESLVLYATLQPGYDIASVIAATQNEADKGQAWAQSDLGRFYRYGYGVEADVAQAVKWLQKSADQKNPEAQAELGRLYQDGTGVKQDLQAAINWYRQAADQGFADAQASLGNLYYLGQGVEQDRNRAARLFADAASRSNRRGQHNLASCYRYGDGVEVDKVRARLLYLLAASQGQLESIVNLGKLYEFAEGVVGNDREAARLYQIASNAGLASAHVPLAIMYQSGRGVSQDYDKARELFLSAAEQGLADGQVGVGALYEAGEGVERDYSQAMQWYQKAADQKDRQGYFRIGMMIYNGKGVRQDYGKAVGWFRAAAGKGYADAEAALGMAYEEGKGAVQDYQAAIRHYNTARESGSGWAAYRLAMMHWAGRGADQVIPTALLQEAVRLGHTGSHRAYALALEEDGRRGVSPYDATTRRRLIIDHLRKALNSGDSQAAKELRRFGVQQ